MSDRQPNSGLENPVRCNGRKQTQNPMRPIGGSAGRGEDGEQGGGAVALLLHNQSIGKSANPNRNLRKWPPKLCESFSSFASNKITLKSLPLSLSLSPFAQSCLAFFFFLFFVCFNNREPCVKSLTIPRV